MVRSLQQPGARAASVLRVKPAGDSSLPAPASPAQSSTVVRLPTVRAHRERRGTGGCYQAPARRRSSCQTLTGSGGGGGFTGGLHLLFRAVQVTVLTRARLVLAWMSRDMSSAPSVNFERMGGRGKKKLNIFFFFIPSDDELSIPGLETRNLFCVLTHR